MRRHLGEKDEAPDESKSTPRISGCCGRTLSTRIQKGQVEILDEFTAVTGYHRKYAIDLLQKNEPQSSSTKTPTQATASALYGGSESSVGHELGNQ